MDPSHATGMAVAIGKAVSDAWRKPGQKNRTEKVLID
jgi:hypothetical protein